MTLDQRLTAAAHRLAERVTPPDVDLDLVRRRARANRRRTVTLAVVAAVLVVIAGGTVVAAGRDTDALPPGPVAPDESDGPDLHQVTCPAPRRQEPTAAPTSHAVVAAQRAWLDQLPTGAPPLTPWWHDGVLHVGDDEFETRLPSDIEVARDTVVIGSQDWDRSGNVTSSEWALVRDGELEPLPAGASNAGLSVDGRLAYWDADPSTKATRLVVWDVVNREEIASHSMPDPFDRRVGLVGIDEDGTAYLVDDAQDHPITAWDVRADTHEPTDLAWDDYRPYGDQCPPLNDLAMWPYEKGYVSPDGDREVFTGPAPGDESPDCCTTLLRVRPVGEADVGPDDITGFQLPDGVPHATLWFPDSDRGTWGVWWETDETVLLDAVIDERSYLVRCNTTDGACERVFDLGPNRNRGIVYYTDWEEAWAFARAPVQE